MTKLPDGQIGSGALSFAKDYIGLDYHNEGHSHIDAFSHVAFDGLLFDGKPDQTVTELGAQVGAIDVLKDGLVGRGVLLDVPRARGVPWLEPGEHVFREDLEAAEQDQGVRSAPATSCSCAPVMRAVWPRSRRGTPRRRSPGLHPTTASLPGRAPRRRPGLGRQQRHRPEHHGGHGFPMHVLALNAMGIHLFDYLQFEDLAGAARRRGAGSSCSSPLPCASSVERDRPSTPSRSSELSADTHIVGAY